MSQVSQHSHKYETPLRNMPQHINNPVEQRKSVFQ